jgi:hypothetical protein
MSEIQQMCVTYPEAALIEAALLDYVEKLKQRTTETMRESKRTGCPCDEEAVQDYLRAFNRAIELREKFSVFLNMKGEAELHRLMSELFDEEV